MYGIFTYIWRKFMVNVAKYTSPMDPTGFKVVVSIVIQFHQFLTFRSQSSSQIIATSHDLGPQKVAFLEGKFPDFMEI